MSDTIAALSTAPAKSGLGVIRISGSGALEGALRLFKPTVKLKPRVMTLGNLSNIDGEIIDSILGVWFPAPNSFTGEEVVELHCHGSIAVLNSALAALYSSGIRPADAGEFTKRAFLNGRMDLSQAEAIGDLIDSEIEEYAINAAAQVRGVLSSELNDVYEDLLLLLAHFQAVVDYPDEDIDEFLTESAIARMKNAAKRLERLIAGTERANILKEGVDCVIIGRPNVGKSSLMNALVGYDRAIVTPIAGTTRDVVDAHVRLGGVPVRLRDTAGIRNTIDPVENIGVDRALAAAGEASLVMLVIDGSKPLTEADTRVLTGAEVDKTILLINKSDLAQAYIPLEILAKLQKTIPISAKTGIGLDLLEAEIRERYSFGNLRYDGTLITNARQEGACRLAIEAVGNGITALRSGYPPDMVLYELEQGIERIGDILGKNTPEELITTIFSKFCVGK